MIWHLSTSYKVARGHPGRCLGRKVDLKRSLGTWYGTYEELGVKGIWKVVGKIDIVHQLLSSEGVPWKVLSKEGNAEENFGHMIWHLRRVWGEGCLEGDWKD